MRSVRRIGINRATTPPVHTSATTGAGKLGATSKIFVYAPAYAAPPNAVDKLNNTTGAL